MLKRLLWLGPTLLVVTLPIFWAVARTADRTSAKTSALPLFFNASPEGVRERALTATATVASGGGDAASAEAELVRLGGAAFPYVLPRFDALGPDARGRVALALVPVARRMGIAVGADLENPESAVVEFSRFWEEHAIDFRPAVVKRTVRRFVEHPSALRASEVSELDTVALEDLMDSLGRVKTPDDVERVRHVTDVLSRITEQPWTVPGDASVKTAARVVERWRRFWMAEQSHYVAFTGPRRLVATVLETRYGHWLAEFFRQSGDSSRGGRTVGVLRRRAPVTLALIGAGFFAGYPLAVLFGVAAARIRRRAQSVAAGAVAVVVSTIGVAGTAAVAKHLLGGSLVWACLAVALATAAMSFRHQETSSERLAELPHLRTAIAFGAPPLRVALRTARLALAAAAALAVADLPGLFTSAFVAEHVFSLRGLGEMTVRALRNGDQAWLLTLALVGTLAVGLAQIGADLLLIALDPRVRRARRVAKSAG
ncbi:MAG TPA: ABC transporter permease subunit [Polyangiaceae bacterium]|nr:ABC transporter permease subunit [Polyangiaceae bacterium]